MTQYLLAVHMVEGAPERSAGQAYASVDAFNAELRAGAWVSPAACTRRRPPRSCSPGTGR